jgi:hypothetical protein
MFKNQFLVTNKNLNLSNHHLDVIKYENINIYYHRTLNVLSICDENCFFILLGYIVNPYKYKQTNNEIVKEIALKCKDTNSLIKKLQSYSGRFVIIFKDKTNFVAINDACCQKQLFYYFKQKQFILTSSEKMFHFLFNCKLQMSIQKKDLIKSENFRKNEFEWYGEKGFDDRLKRILPNHYLDIKKKIVKRTPIFDNNIHGDKEIIEYVGFILKENIKAISNRYNIIQSLTAGWDSRALLAASKDCNENIKYFVADYSNVNKDEMYFNKNDIYIPKRISKKLQINFEIIPYSNLDINFLKAYKKEHVIPRILPKTSEIQHHYFKYNNKNTVRISGIGGDLCRCKNGYTKTKIDLRHLLFFTGYQDTNDYVNDEIKDWLINARTFSEENEIFILDLFHWEQRLGNWGALYPFEQDIAIEEFCPFNNKNLILNLFKVSHRKRSAPNYFFFKKLIKSLWEETLVEPINPGGILKYYRRCIKRNSKCLYYKGKTSKLIKSMLS